METLLTELSQSNTATELEEGGLWMRAQVQRDGLPARRDKVSNSSSSSKRASATDARQHGQRDYCVSSYNASSEPFVVRGKYIATVRPGHTIYTVFHKNDPVLNCP